MSLPQDWSEEMKETENGREVSALNIVAYVYPGWHPSSYRPLVDEWTLLDDFQPYFEGHQPLPRPLQTYDDSKLDTVIKQIELAQEYGVDGFTYFLYYEPEQFTMAEPIQAAMTLAGQVSGFGIGFTWCIRLPHAQFPIKLTDRSLLSTGCSADRRGATDAAESKLPPERIPLEELTLAELEYLIKKYLQDDLPFNVVVNM